MIGHDEIVQLMSYGSWGKLGPIKYEVLRYVIFNVLSQ